MQTITFDDRLLTELNEDWSEFERDVKLGTAIWFYVCHRLTLGQAAELADCSQYELMNALSAHGFSSVDYPAGDLTGEIES